MQKMGINNTQVWNLVMNCGTGSRYPVHVTNHYYWDICKKILKSHLFGCWRLWGL